MTPDSITVKLEKKTIQHPGWTLKFHTRRQMWMLENPMGTRWGFESRELAVRFAETRGIGFTEVVPDNSAKQASDKTLRRRARKAG